MSAIDELRAAATIYADGISRIRLTDAERIITAQEQRLEECEKLKQGYYDEAATGWEKFRAAEKRIEQREQRIKELERERDEKKWDAFKEAAQSEMGQQVDKLSPEVGILRLKVEQQEQRIGELEAHFTDSERYVQVAEKRIADLETLIGQPPEGSHPDEWKPRAATWHQERANWLDEVERLRAHIAALENSKPAADHPEENCLSSECPIHGTAAPSKPAEGTWAWALEQMKAGKRVKHKHDNDIMSLYIHPTGAHVLVSPASNGTAALYLDDFEATDWQLAEGHD